MQYYRSSFASIFCDFQFSAQTSYTQFLINTKLQNNKSNTLLERAYALFF